MTRSLSLGKLTVFSSLMALALLAAPSVSQADPPKKVKMEASTPSSQAANIAKPASPKPVAKPVAKSSPKPKPPVEMGPPQPTVWERLAQPIDELRARAKFFNDNREVLDKQKPATLEGLANDAILAVAVKSILNAATKTQKWTQTTPPRIFTLKHVLKNSALQVPLSFNRTGFRTAIFGLQQGKHHRAVVLSASFQGRNVNYLRELFRNDLVVRELDSAVGNKDFENFAQGVTERFISNENRESRHMPVVGSAQTWTVRCDQTVLGDFCINAKLFDANDTNVEVLMEALNGRHKTEDITTKIREENLAWPIADGFISRGFKFCNSCGKQHLGLDITAPVGTPVHAVADGVIREMKGFSGWGQAIVVEHTLSNGEKFISLYAHLSKFRPGLKVGDSVSRNELLAESGQSGFAATTGDPIPPHLHLEIRKVIPGKEPLQRPTNAEDRPLDPLRVMDVFNLLVGGETAPLVSTPEAH